MGFVIRFVVGNGLRFCLVWGFSVAFVAHEARMERAKRDVGFVILGLLAFVAGEARRGVGIRGLWWKMGPSPGPGPFITEMLRQ